MHSPHFRYLGSISRCIFSSIPTPFEPPKFIVNFVCIFCFLGYKLHVALPLIILVNSQHKLKPLDVVVFSPVGCRWQGHCNTHLYQGVKVNHYNVIQEYMEVWKQFVTPELIRMLFLKMGIYSINLGVFTKEDFAPSQVLSTIVHVPSSFPLDVLTSDPAIPSDAKMESSESDNDSSNPTCFVDLDLSKDDNMDLTEETQCLNHIILKLATISYPKPILGELWQHILTSQSSFIGIDQFQL